MNTTAIKDVITLAASQFESDNPNTKIVTDFHIKVDTTSGGITIHDDEDKPLSSATIPELKDADAATVENTLRSALTELDTEEAFSTTQVFKPFSFLLEDKDDEIISELLIVDDDTIIIGDEELLKGLNEELDDFLNKLLAE